MSISIFVESLFIVLSVIPYIFQLKKLHASNSYEGYSVVTPLLTLAALTLRLNWWYSEQYEMYLFVQALIISIVILLTLFKIAHINFLNGNTPKRFSYTQPNAYIRDFTAFYLVNLIFIVIIRSEIYSDLIGYSALTLESFMVFPQVLEVIKKPGDSGLSLITILGWFAGDLFKLTYFINTDAPTPFILCACLQVIWDSLVVSIPIARKMFPPLDMVLKKVFRSESQNLV